MDHLCDDTAPYDIGLRHRSPRRFQRARGRLPAWRGRLVVKNWREPGLTRRMQLTALQNPFVERLIGSVRRECLEHVLVLAERHLRRILIGYFAYYHRAQTHLSLDKDVPDVRPIGRPEVGEVVQIPEAGGLHHRYVRRAA